MKDRRYTRVIHEEGAQEHRCVVQERINECPSNGTCHSSNETDGSRLDINTSTEVLVCVTEDWVGDGDPEGTSYRAQVPGPIFL